jgi:hypothetical protein
MFDTCRKQIAPGKLLPALSQAVANIAHPHQAVKIQLQRFVAGVTKAFPNHSMWMLLAVHNSGNTVRRDSMKEVINYVKQNADKDVQELIAAHMTFSKAVMVRP